MTTLAHYQAFALDDAGNVLASPSVEVRDEATSSLASLFSDRAGASGIANPFTGGSDGFFDFYVVGGAYKIVVTQGAVTRTLRYVGIGTKSEHDDTPTLNPGATATITVGYTITPFNAGTKSSGTFTPDPTAGNYQYYTNGGAHTLAAPTSDCAMDILVTNNASAGTITFSGFTVGSNIGGTLTNTNTQKFLISLRRINSISTYSVYALQ